MKLDALLDETQARAKARAEAYVAALGKPMALYGAGNMGRMVLAWLRERGIEPIAVFDDTPAKQGGSLDGIPILPARARDARTPVVVTILNPRHHFPDTAARLGGAVLPFLALPWLFPESSLLHMVAPQRLLAWSDRIRALDRILQDDVSRACLAEQIRFRLHLDFALSGAAPDPYFPGDVPLRLQDGMGFLDAGAFDGDTVKMLLSRVARPQQVVAAEPDPSSFSALEAWAATQQVDIRCRNVAVGAEPGKLKFRSTGDMSARLDPDGNIEVPVQTLADLWPAGSPVYAKFDVEGAERDILHASTELLSQRRPQLAVSVYHRAEDLWELPLLLHGLGYRLWLRDHGMEGTDVVAYAIPV